MVSVGFLRPDHGLDPNLVFEYVSAPYVPYLVDEFTFTRQFTADALAKVANLDGPHAAVIRALNMPPSFVILDRVVWGVSALLGKLEATGPLARHPRRVPPRWTTRDGTRPSRSGVEHRSVLGHLVLVQSPRSASPRRRSSR